MAAPFVQLLRTEATADLLRHPNAFALLTLVALRARRDVPVINPFGLCVGEAMLGDCASTGLSRQEFRTAISNLQKWGFITIRTTNKGTIAQLCNSAVYELNLEQANHQFNHPSTIRATRQQPVPNQTTTTNKNVKNIKNEKKVRMKEGAGAPPTLPEKKIAPISASQKKNKPVVELVFPDWATDDFRRGWAEWVEHRQGEGFRKKLPPAALQRNLNKLADFDEAFCLRLFDYAITNGNQGLIFPETAEKFANYLLAQQDDNYGARTSHRTAGQNAAAGNGKRITSSAHANPFGETSPESDALAGIIAAGAKNHVWNI